MGIYRKVLALTVIGWLWIASASVGLAAETWIADPRTGCWVGWVSEDSSLISATWGGAIYEGKAEGKGALIFTIRTKNGQELEGRAEAEMRAGRLEGKVNVKWSNGDSFEGSYFAGQREGQGVFKWASGHMYEGEYHSGLQSGSGKMKWPDGSQYEGEWKHDAMDGHGILKWPDGSSYEGEFRNQLMDGRGIYRYTDGTAYEGEFHLGQRQGLGILRDANGKVQYEGEWQDNQQVNQKEKSAPVLSGFLDIAWGITPQEADKAMTAIAGMKPHPAGGAGNYTGMLFGRPAYIVLGFTEGKLTGTVVYVPALAKEVDPLFTRLKEDLSARYGVPATEDATGKNPTVEWLFAPDDKPGKVALSIWRNFPSQDKKLPPALRRPQAICVVFRQGGI